MMKRTFVQGSGTCKWLSAEVAQARPWEWGGRQWWSQGLPWLSSGSDFAFHAGGMESISGQGAKIPHSWDQNT